MDWTRLLSRTGFGALCLVAGLASAPRIAAADCGTPQCAPQHDGLGVLIGCCNEDCTWKTGGSTARKCINPANSCQQGHCDEINHTCNASYTNPAGHPPCINATDPCLLGECYSQACAAIGNKPANGFEGRCDDEMDCTDDVCNTSGGGTVFESCTNTPLTGTSCGDTTIGLCEQGVCNAGACEAVQADVGTDCSDSFGAICTPKICDDNGDCVQDGDPIECMGTLDVCRVFQCSWDGSTPTCTIAHAPVGTNCDTDAHDCKDQTCRSNGACGNQAAAPNTPCDPDFATPLVTCDSGVCNNKKTCVGITGNPAYNGMTCQTDTDVCTTETCQSGVCTATCSGSGTVCGGCGTAGTCSDGSPPCSCVQ
jgi:hypothetical protein